MFVLCQNFFLTCLIILNMKNLLQFTVLCLLTILWSFNARASHVMGGYITYKVDTNFKANHYIVTLTAYQDCHETKLPSSKLTVTPKGGTAFTATLQRTILTDITPINKGCKQKSLCAGGKFAYGINRYDYIYDVTLNSKYCEYTFSYTDSNLTSYLTNTSY